MKTKKLVDSVGNLESSISEAPIVFSKMIATIHVMGVNIASYVKEID